MTSYKKSKEEFSRDVYEAFQAIAVTSDWIRRRRHKHLLHETLETISNGLDGIPSPIFFVGSQVEGSTTIGMDSDTDRVCIQDDVRVVLKLGDWQIGKKNLLAFKDETTPPQFYKLCRLQQTPDGRRQEYSRYPVHETDVVDELGRVVVSNRIFDNDAKTHLGQQRVVMHGPAKSWTDELDFVFAFPSNDFPEECEFLFTRSRPGHWPKPETLEYARKCRVFFIPQGHPHSPLSDRTLQWRLSTSLTERKLMFDFTEEQMLVYILLKMLKKEYVQPKFGNNFSTFHIKTAMMFSIEKHPPVIWRIDNIVECATYCIDTLIQWAHDNVCPHFTMGGVNLFDGKLSEPDIKELETVLINLNKNIAEYICNLKMDSFGVNVLQKVHDKESTLKGEIEIVRELSWLYPLWFTVCVMYVYIHIMDVKSAETFIAKRITDLYRFKLHGSELQPEAADLMLPYLYGPLASIKASLCMIANQPVSQDIIEMYQLSFERDLLSGKLQYASMLYCSAQYDQAADMLNHCEGLIGPDVAHYCGCEDRTYHYQPKTFLRKGINTSTVELSKTSSTSCVMFCKHELPCVPEHLQYEMYKTQTQKDKNKLHDLVDMVNIDCVPFLYYLQFLVYSQKGNTPRRLLAMFNMMDYINQSEYHGGVKGHLDTALHVLAHCWELENRHDLAWYLYQQSLYYYPTNDTAMIHLIRIFRKYFL